MVILPLPPVTWLAAGAALIWRRPPKVQAFRTMETAKRFYIAVMDRLVHPDLKDVSLAAALHALADPMRLQMVEKLSETECLNAGASCASGTPKSTVSNHLNVLRAAGLVETTAEGRERRSRLRRADFDRRFPGTAGSRARQPLRVALAGRKA